MKIALVKLASCSGCQIALLDTYERVLDLEIVYAPMILDEKDMKSCDLVLVEGAVRTEEELENLKIAREKAKTLVAFGSCSALGGIPSLGDLYTPKQLIESIYGREIEPKLMDFAHPIDEFVDVDYYLPGCPPTPDLIYSFLKALEDGKTPSFDYPVCAECGRIVIHTKIDGIKRTEKPDDKICLLSQGYLCLGSVTRGGCKAVCTKGGIPCKGCRGATSNVMVYNCKDFLTEIHDRLERIAGFDIRFDDPASIYMFVFGSDMKEKPVSKIKEIIRSCRFG